MKDYQDIEQMFKNIDLPDVDVKPKLMKKINTIDNKKENDFLNRTICLTISVILVFTMSLVTTKIYNTFLKDDGKANYFSQTEKILMLIENE